MMREVLATARRDLTIAAGVREAVIATGAAISCCAAFGVVTLLIVGVFGR